MPKPKRLQLSDEAMQAAVEAHNRGLWDAIAGVLNVQYDRPFAPTWDGLSPAARKEFKRLIVATSVTKPIAELMGEIARRDDARRN